MHVTIRHLNLGLVLAAVFSLAALVQTAVPARAQTPMLWQAPIDEAWGYGASWKENPDTGGIEGYLRPQIIVESVEDGMVKGRIAAPSGDILPMYGEDSRITVRYGYDSGGTSPQFISKLEKGEFSLAIPEGYSEADYAELWISGHSFNVKPSGAYPESGVSTIASSPANQTSSSTFVTDDGLEGTIETVRTEESTSTADVDASEESVVTVTTVKSFVTETITVTTPEPTTNVSTAEGEEEEETMGESSMTSNSTTTTSTSGNGRITTVKNVTLSISSETEVTSHDDDENTIKITTIQTNSTAVTTETVSLGYDTNWITIWDNHEHFKIDGYSIFEDEFEERTFYQGMITVFVNPATTEYRL